MAKVQGPCMSLGASGSLANAVSYGMRREGAVAMRKPRHLDRATAGQRKQRASVWYAHDMWRRIGETERDLWRAWFDGHGRNGFQAFSHVLQRRWKAVNGAWVKQEGEPEFPCSGCVVWLTWETVTAFGYLSLADGPAAFDTGDVLLGERLDHQYKALAPVFGDAYSDWTPSAAPDYDDGVTVVADVEPVGTGDVTCVVNHSKGASNVGNWILQRWSNDVVSWRVRVSGSEESASGGELEAGRAHRVAGTYDGTEMRVYVDGYEAGSAAHAGSAGTDTTPVYVGARYRTDTGAGAGWRGWIDNVVIVGRAMEAMVAGRP